MSKVDQQLSSPNECGKRLRILRNMSGLTIHEFSDKYNIGASTIKYWECGKNEGLSAKGAKKIIEAMLQQGVHCTFMWLMYGAGNMPYFIDAHHGMQIVDGSLDEELAIANEIALFLKNTSNAITLRIADDAMDPLFSIGHTVGGNRLYGDGMEKILGKDCIIETDDKQILCRRITKGSTPGNFNLCSINPQSTVVPPNLFDIKVLSVAPIVRTWRRFD